MSATKAAASPVTIDAALCTGCRRCVTICPTDVFRMDEGAGKAHVAFPRDCHVCFLCVDDCEVKAISLDHSVANDRHRSVYADLAPERLALAADASGRKF